MDDHKLVMISIFFFKFQNMKKMQFLFCFFFVFFLMKNMLEKNFRIWPYATKYFFFLKMF